MDPDVNWAKMIRIQIQCFESKTLAGLVIWVPIVDRQEAAARAKCLVYHDRAEAIRTALEAGGRLYSPGTVPYRGGRLMRESVNELLAPLMRV